MIKCTFEKGHQANLRHAVIDALVIHEDQVLLVKRSHSALVEPDKYALPGGFLERDETADQGAIRETMEETGYATIIDRLFLIIHAPRLKGDDRQNVTFVYLLHPEECISSPDHEVSQVGWFDLDNLPNPSQMAFDHLDIINRYKDHLSNPQPLPLINLD